MPIYKGLLCTTEQLKQIRELAEQVAQPLPGNTGEFARLFEERQRAKDQLKTLLASLRPPTIEELAAEVEQLQNKIARLEEKLTEGGRVKREKRPS